MFFQPWKRLSQELNKICNEKLPVGIDMTLSVWIVHVAVIDIAFVVAYMSGIYGISFNTIAAVCEHDFIGPFENRPVEKQHHDDGDKKSATVIVSHNVKKII